MIDLEVPGSNRACLILLEKIKIYVFDKVALSDEERQHVESHIACCADCSLLYKSLKKSLNSNSRVFKGNYAIIDN